MNFFENAIKDTILEKIKDFNLFFNKVEVSVFENIKQGYIDIQFGTKINHYQRINLKELQRNKFDLLEFTTKNIYRKLQEALFEELGNNLKKDKDGLKLIVSSSIPEGMILCHPKTSSEIRMLKILIEQGNPAFRKELKEFLSKGVECETYI